MADPSSTRVSIVVPVHNGGDAFVRCLESIAAASPGPIETVVVADGDSDGAWRRAQDFGARVVRIAQAGGPARARNRGAAAARGELLYFVDADVTIPPDALAQVDEAFASDPSLAALIGSYDDAPGADNFLSQYKNLFHHFVHQRSREQASTFWGACGAIRREVFEAVGGFDEGYRRASIEDIELGYRLRRAGHHIRLLKELQVKHLKRWTVRSLLRADVLDRALPWTRLMLREGELLNDLNLSARNRVSVALVFLLLPVSAAGALFPALLLPAGMLGVGLVILNLDLYRFFVSKRGLAFALKCVPWHWLYLLYSGATFSYGLLERVLTRAGSEGGAARTGRREPT